MNVRSLTSLGLGIALLTLLADQVLKSWAHAWVASHGPTRAFPGLDIIATSNTGMAFSFGQGTHLWVLVAIALAISGWLLWWLFRTQRRVEAIGLGLAIGGAISNIVDRLRLGAVRDFIDVYWRDWHWPAFNVADAAIVCGLALVILGDIGRPRKQKANKSQGSGDQLGRSA